MKTDNRKIGIVGCGQVGMSYAFSLLQSGICNRLVLIDIDQQRIRGEAADLGHAVSFLERVTKVYAGDYKDLRDADMVLIAAGAAQKPGEDRMALLQRNANILAQIIPQIVQSGFEGIYLVATNPVDVMAWLTEELSHAPSHRVIGSGTVLDTGRARYLIGEFFRVDPKNVHAYVLGEHGESEFIAMSSATVGGKAVTEICEDDPLRFPLQNLWQVEEKTRDAAAEIIAAKGSTCYGIASALCKLTDAIYADDGSVFTLSCRVQGEYGLKDVYIGVPAVITRKGIREIVTIPLSDSENKKMQASGAYLYSMCRAAAPHFV